MWGQIYGSVPPPVNLSGSVHRQIPIFCSLENTAMYDTRQHLHMNAGSNTAEVSTSQITAKYPSA